MPPDRQQRICSVRCRGFGHTTMAHSVFEAAAQALHWFEVECRVWGTAFRADDSEWLEVIVVAGQRYRVQARSVRCWRCK